ncbi:hypothetical protein JZ751_001906 [Albula glossodonta]|uniref:Uncharacterized protein n=1 Tax=Albula glossodonta TaxID=121402 RepID=A0A8T2PAD2_9TELE|nr:hypothetical protein JZ751_001906 [Albula glossodonta]
MTCLILALPECFLLLYSMILLGSIERSQLQSLLSQQLGRPRRLEYLRERSHATKKRLSTVSQTGSEEAVQRVNQEVRFQVSHGSGGQAGEGGQPPRAEISLR